MGEGLLGAGVGAGKWLRLRAVGGGCRVCKV